MKKTIKSITTATLLSGIIIILMFSGAALAWDYTNVSTGYGDGGSKCESTVQANGSNGGPYTRGNWTCARYPGSATLAVTRYVEGVPYTSMYVWMYVDNYPSMEAWVDTDVVSYSVNMGLSYLGARCEQKFTYDGDDFFVDSGLAELP
jgi:hypothetical protein